MGPPQEEQQIQDSNKGNNYEALHSRKVLQNNLGYNLLSSSKNCQLTAIFLIFQDSKSEEISTVNPPLDLRSQASQPKVGDYHDVGDLHGGKGKHAHDYGTHIKYHEHDPGATFHDAKTLRPEPTAFSEKSVSSLGTDVEDDHDQPMGPTPYSEVSNGPTPYSEVANGPTPYSKEPKGPTPYSEISNGPTPNSEVSIGPTPFSEAPRGPTPYSAQNDAKAVEPTQNSDSAAEPTPYEQKAYTNITPYNNPTVASTAYESKSTMQVTEGQTSINKEHDGLDPAKNVGEIEVQTERSVHDTTRMSGIHTKSNKMIEETSTSTVEGNILTNEGTTTIYSKVPTKDITQKNEEEIITQYTEEFLESNEGTEENEINTIPVTESQTSTTTTEIELTRSPLTDKHSVHETSAPPTSMKMRITNKGPLLDEDPLYDIPSPSPQTKIVTTSPPTSMKMRITNKGPLLDEDPLYDIPSPSPQTKIVTTSSSVNYFPPAHLPKSGKKLPHKAKGKTSTPANVEQSKTSTKIPKTKTARDYDDLVIQHQGDKYILELKDIVSSPLGKALYSIFENAKPQGDKDSLAKESIVSSESPKEAVKTTEADSNAFQDQFQDDDGLEPKEVTLKDDDKEIISKFEADDDIIYGTIPDTTDDSSIETTKNSKRIKKLDPKSEESREIPKNNDSAEKKEDKLETSTIDRLDVKSGKPGKKDKKEYSDNKADELDTSTFERPIRLEAAIEG